MGNWHVSIEGQGSPDNPTDANLLAHEFVERLRQAGHVVTRATFTHGGAEQLAEEAKQELRVRPHATAPWTA